MDKKQLKEAIDNYRIMKGYNLKITKSDTGKISMSMLGQGL